MLKRLLSRDKAASAVAVPDANLPARSAPAAPAAASNAPNAAAEAATKRNTKSMRDSDIKDELGRSAEEIAAEAAQEFDIDAVVRKAAAMPDVVVEKAHKAAPPVAAAPDTAAPTVLPTAVPAPAPAQSYAPVPTPVSAVKVNAGHIELPNPSADVIVQTRRARAAYWDGVGVSDLDFLGYRVSPQVQGMPAWPSLDQQFRVVRTANSLIIASEGLSDPFGAFDLRGQHPDAQGSSGFGVEVFLEISGGQELSADDVRKTWAFRAVEHVARIFAFGKNLSALVHDNDVLSVDLPADCVPQGWIVPGVAEPAGALLNMGQPSDRATIKNMPLGNVRAVPLTPIYPEELESCLIEGPSERRALANDLLTAGIGHRMVTSRTSLR